VSELGHAKVVKAALLTDKDIDINKQFKGTTPGHTEIAAMLQQHGTE